ERFICSGNFLYQFVPEGKEIRVYELNQTKSGQVGEDNFLSFLFGMKAEEAKRRYDLRLEKQDQHWIYIRVYPRFDQDKVDFQEAQVVLGGESFLPRRLWFLEPNGNEVTWDIPRIDPKAPVNRADFGAPAVPPGWELKRVPRNPQNATRPNEPPPRVVRPQQ